MGHDKITVVLADDHVMVRQGLGQALEEHDGIQVVAQAGNGAEAVRRMAETNADILICDYTMPDGDGPAVTAQLLREHPAAKVVVLTMHDNIHYVQKAMDAGAQAFVVKSDGLEDLIKAVHAVKEGRTWVTPRLAEKLSQHVRGPKGRHLGLDKLSQREFELLRFMGRGMSLQECASLMKISESTASTYRARLMTKLELGSTAQIIRYALENGVTA
jgi:DNA-binding NarL/FixJ family response regulator